MKKNHGICLLIIALVGGVSFGFFIAPLLSAHIPSRAFSPSFWAIVFIGFTFWTLHGIEKEMQIRDQERQVVEEHERKKRSVILSKHPLHDQERDVVISSTQQLEWYYEEHLDDVADMDYDSSGKYVFRDHKYIFR